MSVPVHVYINTCNCHGVLYHIVLYCVLAWISCVGQWSVPIISGQCPPPCYNFTLNELPHNRGIMFGGYGGGGDTWYNDIYIIKLTKDSTVVSKLNLYITGESWDRIMNDWQNY